MKVDGDYGGLLGKVGSLFHRTQVCIQECSGLFMVQHIVLKVSVGELRVLSDTIKIKILIKSCLQYEVHF